MKGWMLPVLTDGGGGTTITISDTAAGTDAIGQIAASLLLSDSALGADGFGNLAASVALADTGAAADTITMSVHVPVSDSGQGSDAISILQALLKLITDLATGIDTVGVSIAPLTVSDVAAGNDSIGIAVNLSVADIGHADDTVATLQALFKLVSDAALGTDTIPTIRVAVPISDAGHGLDTLGAISVAARVADAAHGYDTIIVITGDGPTRRLVITVTPRAASLSVTSTSSKITFH